MEQKRSNLIIEGQEYTSLRFFPAWNLFEVSQMHGLLHMIDDIRSKAQHNSVWVEVGSFYGESAALMLGHKFIKKLHCVDRRISKWLRLRTAGAIERCELHEMSSESASKQITNFDVVYIDADHTYESVKSDIAAWYPGLTSGGALCGHDYNPKTWPGVVQAVDEFCAEHDYTIIKYIDSSWMLIKR